MNVQEIGNRIWPALLIAVTGCAATPAAPEPGVGSEPSGALTPFDGIRVEPSRGVVEIDAWTCLESGWLEQIACGPQSREHESLVVVAASPSDIHAALLLAGFRPGSPGYWRYEAETLALTPPTGDPVEVLVRVDDQAGETPIGSWIRDGENDASFPDDNWVFAGSRFEPNPEWMGPGEHYAADLSGSIVGLVTFGDEVVGFARVLADQDDVQPPQWQVRESAVPPAGTKVTLILRRP